MEKTRKITIAPVSIASPYDEVPFLAASLPYSIGSDTWIEPVGTWLENANFSLWEKHVGKDVVEDLQGWQHGIVVRFEGLPNYHSPEEVNSEEHVHKVFVAVRLVRPTRVSYGYVSGELKSDDVFDPRSFQAQEPMLNVPHAEILNTVRPDDLATVREILPCFLHAYNMGQRPITRAIKYFEAGYINRMPEVQGLLWMVALDGLFTSRDWANSGQWVTKERILAFLGEKTKLYDQRDFPTHIGRPPQVVVRDVIDDVVELRNTIAHGDWPDKLIKAPGRTHLDQQLSYADELREATSAILRLTLVKIFKDGVAELFADKAKLNAHFGAMGLVRKQKKP